MAVKPCSHIESSRKEISKEIGGHKFVTTVEVCSDCGAELWQKDKQEAFYQWLNEADLRPRIQFKMASSADRCLDEMLKPFPKSNKSTVVRAMIVIYTNLLSRGEPINTVFNQIYESDYFRTFEEDGSSKMFNVDVKPILFLEMQSWGRLFDLKPNEFAWEAFHLMMAISVSSDPNLIEFWKREILPQLESIIKAA